MASEIDLMIVPFDMESAFTEIERLTDNKFSIGLEHDVFKGYKIKEKIGSIEIVMPIKNIKESYYKKKQRDARCRSRAGIEGLISHLKHDHRVIRNYLKGTAGDQINTLLATAAYNMRKWMRLKRQEILFFLFRWYYQTIFFVPVNIQSI